MSAQVSAVPEKDRRKVPEYAKKWGDDVDYPAPALITEELRQNIALDSIFVKSGELIIPDKCEECRNRAKGCDRARPTCGRCTKIGRVCIPVSTGHFKLRKGRSGKALPARIWAQSEDPDAVVDNEPASEEQEAKPIKSTIRNEGHEMRLAAPLQAAQQTKKRKREVIIPQTQPFVSSLPPSQGHYVDYTSLPLPYPLLAPPASEEISVLLRPDSNDIPIDPQLLGVSAEPQGSPSAQPSSKRPKLLSPSSILSLDTGMSTPTLVEPNSTRQSSFTTSGYTSPTTPYTLVNLSLTSPTDYSHLREPSSSSLGLARQEDADSQPYPLHIAPTSYLHTQIHPFESNTQSSSSLE